MNYTILMLATLMACSFSSVLGIMCKKCEISSPSVYCDKPGDTTEVNCDNETQPASGAKFDSCFVAKTVSKLITTYSMACAVKGNSSDPNVVNCTTNGTQFCALHRRLAADLSDPLISCSFNCCTTNNCNVKELIQSPEPTQPAGSTEPPETTAGSNTPLIGSVNQIQPHLLSFLLISVAVFFKELNECF